MHQGYPQQAEPTPSRHLTHAVGGALLELSPDDRRTIASTAGRMRNWGVVSLLLGLGQLGISQSVFSRASPLATSTHIAGGIASIVVGAVFLGVAPSLRAVVTSHGGTMTSMTNAMRGLGTALRIQMIMAIVGFVLGFVFGVAAIA